MNPRAALRIARAELSKTAGTLDRRTVLLAVGAALIIWGLLAFVASAGVGLDDGLYRVGVSEDSRFYGPVTTDSTFTRAHPDHAAFDRGELELLIDGSTVLVRDTPKGRAAAAEFRTAVREFNDRSMAEESAVTAAFPVIVSLEYRQREAVDTVSLGDGTMEDGSNRRDPMSGTSDSGSNAASEDPSTSGDEGASREPATSVPGPTGGSLFGDGGDGTPSTIAPPFPFESLLLAFVFIIPMNFVIQAYGSSLMGERINRRGQLLLVAPITKWDVIAGLTLPYLGVMIGIIAVVSLGIGGGVISVLAVVPVAVLFLAATFVAAVFARSFKELTFLTVTISVLLTTYLFVPAIFTNVGPVAAISPLSLVVRDLQGQAVSLLDYTFSTAPSFLTSGVLFALGAGIYHEEDLFTQRPVPLKAIDALDARLRGPGSVALLTVLFIPFVFAAELLTVAFLFALPLTIAVPLMLVVIVVIEEVAKSIHVYAGYASGRFDRGYSTAISLGLASGSSFYLAEKVTLVVQLVGLTDLQLGRIALVSGGLPPGAAGTVLAAVLLLAPLALHVTATTLAVVGASHGRRTYPIGLGLAILVHLGYNAAVVSYVT